MVEEFRVALSTIDGAYIQTFGDVIALAVGFTGETIAEITSRLRVRPVYTVESIADDIKAWADRVGTHPMSSTSAEWLSRDQWLRYHTGRGLADLVRGLGFQGRAPNDHGRTVERAKAEMEAFKAVHGRYPAITESREWVAWGGWLSRRGVKWSSLTGRGQSVQVRNDAYSIDDVRADITRFVEAHGRPPRPADGQPWGRYRVSLARNGISLRHLCEELAGPKSFTAQVLTWFKAHPGESATADRLRESIPGATKAQIVAIVSEMTKSGTLSKVAHGGSVLFAIATSGPDAVPTPGAHPTAPARQGRQP
jgi:hypothetical protein